MIKNNGKFDNISEYEEWVVCDKCGKDLDSEDHIKQLMWHYSDLGDICLDCQCDSMRLEQVRFATKKIDARIEQTEKKIDAVKMIIDTHRDMIELIERIERQEPEEV